MGTSIHDPETFKVVDRLVTFYKFKFLVKESKEDILNDVILSLMESHYLERYDDTRPLHQYLSGCIYNFFCKLFRKEQYAVNQASGLETSLTQDGDFALLDTIDSAVNEDTDLEISLHQIEDNLSTKFDTNTCVLYDDHLRFIGVVNKSQVPSGTYHTIDRSAKMVFVLLKQGFTQIEIKKLLHSSKSWISDVVSYISSLPDLIAVAKDLGYRTKK